MSGGRGGLILLKHSVEYMNLLTRSFLTFLVLVPSAVLLIGCADNAPVKVREVDGGPSLEIGYRVPEERGPGFYALLEPVANEWKVLRFGTELPQRTDEAQEILFITPDGSWVQPAYGYAFKKHAYFGCAVIAKKVQSEVPNVRTYGPCDGSRFATVNVASTAAAQAFLLPISLGLYAGTNRVVDVTAIQAALKSTELLLHARRAVAAQRRVEVAIKKLNHAASELGGRASKSIVFDERVIDESGFFNRPGDKFGRLVRLQQPNPSESYKTELTRMPLSYSDAIQYAAAYEDLEQRIVSATAKLPESYVLDLQCGNSQSGSFAVKLECVPQVRWSDIARNQKVALTARILKVTPRALAPTFMHADDTLQVRVDRREIQLVNRSAVYLDVLEVSCYTDDEISTKRWGAEGGHLTLPPNGQLKQPLQQSEVCQGSTAGKLELPTLRFEDVKGRNLRFGIAVKFRRGGEAVDRTLFQQRALPLDALVREAI